MVGGILTTGAGRVEYTIHAVVTLGDGAAGHGSDLPGQWDSACNSGQFLYIWDGWEFCFRRQFRSLEMGGKK